MTAPVPARLAEIRVIAAKFKPAGSGHPHRPEVVGGCRGCNFNDNQRAVPAAFTDLLAEVDRLRAAETRVRELVQGHAITAHAIGHTDYERKFLDILHVLGDQP